MKLAKISANITQLKPYLYTVIVLSAFKGRFFFLGLKFMKLWKLLSSYKSFLS